jgi:hypothetical protein
VTPSLDPRPVRSRRSSGSSPSLWSWGSGWQAFPQVFAGRDAAGEDRIYAVVA